MRTSPKSNSASLGLGEQVSFTLASMFRTSQESVEKRLDVVFAPDPHMVAWLIKYIPRARNLSHVGEDGLTYHG